MFHTFFFEKKKLPGVATFPWMPRKNYFHCHVFFKKSDIALSVWEHLNYIALLFFPETSRRGSWSRGAFRFFHERHEVFTYHRSPSREWRVYNDLLWFTVVSKVLIFWVQFECSVYRAMVYTARKFTKNSCQRPFPCVNSTHVSWCTIEHTSALHKILIPCLAPRTLRLGG